MVEPKEIKAEIRRLRKLKKDLRPGSKERIEIFRQIKDLKKQKVIINTPEPGKEKLIAEILKIEEEQRTIPRFINLGIDLHIYTIEQLEIHLRKIKGLDRKQ